MRLNVSRSSARNTARIPADRRQNSAKSLALLTAMSCLLVLMSFAFLGTTPGSAATPASGTISEAAPVLTYDAGPFNIPNQSPLGAGQLDQGPRCNGQFPCDNFTLTVSLPQGYAATHPNASVKVTMFWADTGTGQSDYDLYIYKGEVPTLSGSQQADYQAASQANPEVASISPLFDGDRKYTLKIVPYIPTQEVVHVRMEFLTGTGGGGFPGFGGPDPTAPGKPRYQTFFPPAGSSAEASNGEMNIGFNPKTGRIMVMNRGPVWRLTTPERLTPAQPECCESLWEDKSNLTTLEGVDPILWTDQKTGRTIASNSTAGTNVVYGYTDNDGDLWNPLSLSGPNASSDHETIGSGPYPASLSALTTPLNQGQAVYYCAQTWPVGAAACQRSDTLGTSYGPSTLPYDGQTTQCSFIHGHVKVGPDGTVYLPVRDCGGNAGVAVSTDAGITWTEHIVPNSKTQTHGSDPSIAVGSNNTVYFFYVADQTSSPEDPKEGHIHVQVSKDRGATWSKDTDLGVSHGIKNAVFPEGVSGDDNRAAVGFLGTDRPGDFEGASFPGIWYPFVATTFDGGDTWTVVNTSPNDPVQGVAGIWLGGGSNRNRNLLDFNEITIDDKGRVLFGYSDGCVGDCVGDPSNNSYGARIRVARQTGGRTLFATNDPNTDTTTAKLPKAACLTGTRDPDASHLTWKAPDDGGADIVNYQVFRGTISGSHTLIGETGGPKAAFHDTTADPSVAHYYYVVKAINAAGTGLQSNEIDLTVTPFPPVESVCEVPGLTKLTDPAADTTLALGIISTPSVPGTDLLSFQLAQPFAEDGVPRLVFTINTDAGQSPQPPGSAWYVAMKIVRGETTNYKGVHMAWNGGTPVFESYTPGASNSGGVDGRFVDGDLKPAEPGSSYAPPYNKVVIIVKASDLGLVPGDTISGFVSGVSQTTDVANLGAGAAALYDQMPQSLTFAGTYTVNANAFCAPQPPVNVCYQDDDSHIAYSSGWHLVNSSNASAGHFRFHSGQDPTHFAGLTVDVPAGQTGTLTYTYARSTKGGSAEVFIDGVSRGTINFNGPNGAMRQPEFQSGGEPYSASYDGLSPGQHTFELRNLSGSVYIDEICLSSAVSQTQPATGPGQTSSKTSSISAGQQSISSLTLPANATEISVLAEATGGLPVKLILLDSAGLSLKVVDSVNGVAVLNAPVTQGGLYKIKVVNLSLGPVQVWTAATPLLIR